MKKIFVCLSFFFVIFSLSGQTGRTQPAPGLEGRLAELLNKPAMISPATASPLGRNWFRVETDAHVISDEVSVAQVTAVLLDLENQAAIYNGKKSKLTANIISRGVNESLVDFVTVSVGPLNIQLKTPYRAQVRVMTRTDKKIALEVRQVATDSDSNRDIKNLFATRYAEELTINGKTYTYIRIYTIDDVNASILPGAQRTVENSAGPINEETLQLIVTAAKSR